MRQVFIDTETTGLHAASGDRIIEIGAVELVGRERTGREFHKYLQPDRAIDEGAVKVHGISDEQLVGCPRFAEVCDELIEFLRDAELVAHNAKFDIDFLDAELDRLGGDPPTRIEDLCSVRDTLILARRTHPGSANSLDALCERYGVDISHREFHGALKDANLLADLYLAMTGGQMGLFSGESARQGTGFAPRSSDTLASESARGSLILVPASAAELEAHEAFLHELDEKSADGAIWRRLTAAQSANIQES